MTTTFQVTRSSTKHYVDQVAATIQNLQLGVVLVSPVAKDDVKNIKELLGQLPKMDTYAHPEMEWDLGLPQWDHDLCAPFTRAAKCLVLQLPAAGHDMTGNAWSFVLNGPSEYNLRVVLLSDKPLDPARIPHQLSVVLLH